MYKVYFFKNALLLSILTVVFCAALPAQSVYAPTSDDSLKGSITAERVWWDVKHYDINFELNAGDQSIAGKNTITYEVIKKDHTPFMQIDLQEPLKVDSIKMGKNKLPYKKFGFAYLVNMSAHDDGEGKIEVYYSGKPKISTNPPYDGGFSWARDSLDRLWVSVSCQLVGGSVWYPCKDHYSEEPDNGATVSITIADSLGTLVSNGRLRSKTKLDDSKSEYVWEVINPVNNYGLSFYVGHYIHLDESYVGEKGTLDLDFYVLDYNEHRAIGHMIPEVRKTLKAFEKWFGPYPFYEDGFKMVESSYIGMEHQSAIAYGNKFRKGRFSFSNLTDLDLQTDRLIVHEMAHEWFGNNITMADMADRWVQEGFAAYGEEMFIEELLSHEAGREFFLKRQRKFIKNKVALISDYGIFKDAGPDMYFKGWAIIHMLREIVNDDEKFRACLRDMNSYFYHKTIYSAQLEKFLSDYFQLNLENFFDQYLRHAAIPVLEYRIEGRKLTYRLSSDVSDLEMPIQLLTPAMQITADANWKSVKLKKSISEVTIDPNFLVTLVSVDETKEH